MRAFILSLAFTASSTSMALAADLGQYRPGNAYQSVIAQAADICENHCSGDAQCRSWNYVKTNPKAAGVCEFNTNDVAPVPSAISISGANSFGNGFAATRHSDRIIAGGTNTIRVGTQSAQRPPAARQVTRSNRRIVREPVPQTIRPQTASTRPVIQKTNPGSLTEQQNQYRAGKVSPSPVPRPAPNMQPRQVNPQIQQQAGRSVTPRPSLQRSQPNAVPQFRYELGGQTAAAPRQMRRPAMPNGYAPQSQQRLAPKVNRTSAQGDYRNRRRQQGPSQPLPMQRQAAITQPQAPMGYQGQAYQGQRGQAYPPQMNQMQPRAQQAPQMPPQGMQRRTANQPMTYVDAQASRLAPNAQRQQSPRELAQGLTAEQAHQSLFGKLNDDVRVPNSGGVIPSDPNAPIATASSRPAGQVEQGKLGELVGAPQR